jgi:peptide/nickel transport system permease protein
MSQGGWVGVEQSTTATPETGVGLERAGRTGRSGRALVSGVSRPGVALILGLVVVGLLGSLLAPYGTTTQIPGANLLPPGRDPAGGLHLLGTDQVNRDVLSRLLVGLRVDLLIAFVAVPLGALAGSVAGVLATWWTPVDVLAQRFFDVLLAFPAVILAIAVTAIAGPGLTTVIAVIVFVEIPVFGRLIRSAVLGVRDLPYVQAAEVTGAGRWWLLRRHILPNSLEPLLVQLAISMSVAVFVESAMSFIGIGVRPPTPSLGTILAESLTVLDANPAFAVAPLVVIALLILGFQLIAQSLAERRRS